MHRVRSPSPYLNCPRFTMNMKVRLREVSPCERRERKHKILPFLCESRTCWNVDTYVTRVFIMNFAVRQIPKQRPLTAALLSAPLCAGLAISLTHGLLSPCIVSPPPLSLHTHCHFTIQGFLCLWHWSLCCGAEMIWWRMIYIDISTSSSTPPRTPPHSLPQAQRAV